MSIRIIKDNINKDRIQLKRKTKKSINTDGWIVKKSNIESSK